MSNYAVNIIVVYVCCGLKANMQFYVERANSCVFVVFFFVCICLLFCISEQYLGFGKLKKADNELG